MLGKGKDAALSAAHLGQDGLTICTMAYGQEVVPRAQVTALGSLVDVGPLRQRTGQLGVLYGNDETLATTRLEGWIMGRLMYSHMTNAYPMSSAR